MDRSIRFSDNPTVGYRVVDFRDVGAGSSLAGAGLTHPLAPMVRLGTGRVIEIDLGLNDGGAAVVESDRRLLPPSGSALILTEAELEELDEHLEGWEHAAHSLSDQNRTDQE